MTIGQEYDFKAPSHVPEEGAAASKLSPAPLLGTWTNIDKSTRDIVKVVVAASDSGISVDVFGACSPTPCNWGLVTGMAYAPSVGSGRAVAFNAQYKFSFALVMVVGHLQGSQLVVETFTEFTDGSGRSNLYTTDQMVK